MPNWTQSCVKVSACLFLWGLAFSLPLWADEIVTITDQSGRRIFINTSETHAKGNWKTNGSRAKRTGTATATPAPTPTPEISSLVERSADRMRVDPQLVHAIIKVESQYDPLALSNKGAMGLMQLIPETAQRFGVANPFDPKDNIEGGVSYLRHLLDMFGGDLPRSLAAYNAGEGAVQRSGGIPSYTETQDYVRKVTHIYQSASGQTGAQAAGYKAPVAPIVRYVDERGEVHYSNVE
ncbi:MAG: lytic transglycosylase domain-containing protein [Terriglobia bacterium]|jgi:soluble lytic murein transglycosylase-like protein